MMFKVLSVAMVLLSFLMADCLRDHLPKGCTEPENSQNFNIGQLDGTTWYAQRLFNTKGGFEYDCVRAEYAKRLNGTEIFKSFVYYNMKTSKNGIFTNDLYEVSQTHPSKKQFILQDLKDKSMVIYAHTIRYDDYFVDSICFTKGGEFLIQGYVLWTKDGKATNETLSQVEKESGIKVSDTYVIYQGEECLKYEKKD